MGALAQAIGHEFDSDTQSRGAKYFWTRRALVTFADSKKLVAQVTGNEKYKVTLQYAAPKQLVAECTCPAFEQYGPCKHIWAAVLAADNQRAFAPPWGGRLELDLGGDEDFEAVPSADAKPKITAPLTRKEQVLRELLAMGISLHPAAPRPPKPAPPPAWKQALTSLRSLGGEQTRRAGSLHWPANRQVVYVIDHQATLRGQGLILKTCSRLPKQNGDWRIPTEFALSTEHAHGLPDAADRELAALLTHNCAQQPGYGYYSYIPRACALRLDGPIIDLALTKACKTGRCFFAREPDSSTWTQLRLDDGPPWEFWLAIARSEKDQTYRLRGELRRGAQPDQRAPVTDPALIISGGWAIWPEKLAPVVGFDALRFQWASLLRQKREIAIPFAQAGEFLAEIAATDLPRVDWPPDLRFDVRQVKPRHCLKVQPARYSSLELDGFLSFDYDGIKLEWDDRRAGIFYTGKRILVRRDADAERAAEQRLAAAGFKPSRYDDGRQFIIPSKIFPRAIRALLAENWAIEAHGKLYRTPRAVKLNVSSGIDWFDLNGRVEFDGGTAGLPALLDALKRGEDMLRLDDGTFGVLPEEWLRKYGVLAGLGTVENGQVRFKPSQAGLLDALLAAQPEATCDATFARVREELRSFEKICPADAPAGFIGQLRPYQKDGLGWLNFLQRFNFGGCLADDMGLGKTIQVLALLESRRAIRETCATGGLPTSARLPLSSKERGPGGEVCAPALAVVPRSLVFNWKREAARFAPKLKVLDHTGIARTKDDFKHFAEQDLILTTYGTLRRDAAALKDVNFDYVILDEAQAIKNSTTASAKAARLLQARHRLCLTGTPVENHLGELWSLFEFLNPGMLGQASVFKLAGTGAREVDDETRGILAKALRPFILRRTKGRVARDLPAKLEETLYCELEGEQKKLYDELRGHYRRALLPQIERDGINKAKIQILEALLRLRQAACHPGLINPEKNKDSSAKLEALLPQLSEVTEGGHKALVFSQFTSFLAILKSRLDKEGVAYEYLDGQTRDREARVKNFQDDRKCKLFLISLKAGGLGLNLTAAEYVFLLDPWWNPAVEAQAIDRAHRIGQTQKVFAYRLIAKGTVEEKVLELQSRKRALADAIISADSSLLRDLGREDLEMLLS